MPDSSGILIHVWGRNPKRSIFFWFEREREHQLQIACICHEAMMSLGTSSKKKKCVPRWFLIPSKYSTRHILATIDFVRLDLMHLQQRISLIFEAHLILITIRLICMQPNMIQLQYLNLCVLKKPRSGQNVSLFESNLLRTSEKDNLLLARDKVLIWITPIFIFI